MGDVREADIARLRAAGATIDRSGRHVVVTAGGETFRFHQGSHAKRWESRCLERALCAAERAGVAVGLTVSGEDLMRDAGVARTALPPPVDGPLTVAAETVAAVEAPPEAEAVQEPTPEAPECAVPDCRNRAVARTGLCDETHGAVTQWAERRGLLNGPEDALAAWQLWEEHRAATVFPCRHCGEVFADASALGRHVWSNHPEQTSRRRAMQRDRPIATSAASEVAAAAEPHPAAFDATREYLRQRIAAAEADIARWRADLAALDAAAEVLARIGGGAA